MCGWMDLLDWILRLWMDGQKERLFSVLICMNADVIRHYI
jgi:hypothetical protein